MAKKKRNMNVDAAEPPMSAMIDVVFLLLIYFIATQKELIPEAHLAINLPSPPPKTSTPPPEEPPVTINITVLSSDYFFMDVPYSIATIENELMKYGKQNPDATVMIKTAVEARNRRLVTILDLCKKANLESLNVVTLQ